MNGLPQSWPKLTEADFCHTGRMLDHVLIHGYDYEEIRDENGEFLNLVGHPNGTHTLLGWVEAVAETPKAHKAIKDALDSVLWTQNRWRIGTLHAFNDRHLSRGLGHNLVWVWEQMGKRLGYDSCVAA